MSISGDYQSNYGIFGNGVRGGQNNVDLVINLQSNEYWSGTYHPSFPGSAWSLVTIDGGQTIYSYDAHLYAWAVRPSDVAAVPAPAAIRLFSIGLGFFAFYSRRKVQG